MTDRRDRAASVSVNYILSLVIVAMLISGLFLSANTYVTNQRDMAIRSEFGVIGNRLASDISTADQMARAAGTTADTEVEVVGAIPDSTAGSEYTINVTAHPQGGFQQVVINMTAGRYTVQDTVTVKTSTPVVNNTVSGGNYVVVYVDTGGGPAPDALEVQNRG